MDAHSRNAAALRLKNAEVALRNQWGHRNLYLPAEEITSALGARKRNARAAIRWYIGEIRSLRLCVPGLATCRGHRALPAQLRGGASGYPVQIWTRAVTTTPPTAPHATWIALPVSSASHPADETLLAGRQAPTAGST